jgi:hypothetical protein
MARVWFSQGKDVRDAVCSLDLGFEAAEPSVLVPAPLPAARRAPSSPPVRSPVQVQRTPGASPGASRTLPGLEELARLYEARMGQALPAVSRSSPAGRDVLGTAGSHPAEAFRAPASEDWDDPRAELRVRKARPTEFGRGASATGEFPESSPSGPGFRTGPETRRTAFDAWAELELPPEVEVEALSEWDTEMLIPHALQQTLPRIPTFVDRSPDYDPPAPLIATSEEPTWSIEPIEDQAEAEARPARGVRLEVLVLAGLALFTAFVFTTVAVAVAAAALGQGPG